MGRELLNPLERRRPLLFSLPGILFQPFACALKVRHVNDVVPVENGPRAMAADLLGHAVLDAGALHVSHGGPPQVMEEQAGQSGACAGVRPAIEVIVHRATMRSVENPSAASRAGLALTLQPRKSHIGRPWSGDGIGGTGTRPNQDSRDAASRHQPAVARAGFSPPAGCASPTTDATRL